MQIAGGLHAAHEIRDDDGQPLEIIHRDISPSNVLNRTGTIGGCDGNYSMDCSPTMIFSGRPPLQFGGSFTSSGLQVSLSDQSPDCTTGVSVFAGCVRIT